MNDLPVLGVGVVVVAVGLVGFMIGEWLQQRIIVWIAKPIASAGFLLVAWEQDAFASTYGIAIFVGLALSFLGDVLLIPKAQAAFLGGLVAFLLGHVGYAVAFGLAGASSAWIVVALLLLIPARLGILKWLRPHLPEEMQLPVEAYAAVITIMLAFSVGMIPVHGWIAFTGAFLFYLSDLSVARDRFVADELKNRLWGLPAYYGGQVVIALSI